MRRRRHFIGKAYQTALQEGMENEARLLKMMLDNGHLVLGMDEVSMEVASFLEDVGCTMIFNKGCMVARL